MTRSPSAARRARGGAGPTTIHGTVGTGRAFAWGVGNALASRVGTMAIGIVLARLLGPESFGTYAVALVAMMALLSFNELGVSLAVVRWPGDPARIVPTVNTVVLTSSAVVAAAAFLAAPAFARAMGDPEAAPVVQVMVLSVVVNGAAATPAALLQRTFQERRRFAIDQVNVWVGAVTSLSLAMLGFGAMSLAAGRVLASLLAAALFVRYSPVPYRFGLDRAVLRPLMTFGLPLAGASVVVFATSYADQLTVGGVLGATQLAFFVLALNVAAWPTSIVSPPLRRIAPALFASVQQTPHRARAALHALLVVVACGAPVVLFVAGASRVLVDVVYGPGWTPAAGALSWLAVGALARLACELAYDFLVVAGRTRRLLALQVAVSLVLVPALALGASGGGLTGAAMASALVLVGVAVPLYLWQLARVGLDLRALARGAALPLATGLAVLAATSGMAAALPWVWALVGGATLAGVASGGLLLLNRASVRVLTRTPGREPDVMAGAGLMAARRGALDAEVAS